MTETAAARWGSKAGAILALCRVSNLPTVWMNVVAAAVLAGAGEAGAVVLLAASMSAFYCGGIALNDLSDREWDAREQPYRPIPSGRVTVGQAQLTTYVLFGSGFALLLLAPFPTALLPALVLLGLIVAYDRFHKQHPASVLLMAGCRLMVFTVSSWALVGNPLTWALAGGSVCFAYTLLISVAARHENTRGRPYAWPVVPRMIAGMSVVDGAFVGVVVAPLWILPGLAAALLTHLGQRWVRGD